MQLNKTKIRDKTNTAAAILIHEKVYISRVDLFLKMEVITPRDYEGWRMGRLPILVAGGRGTCYQISTNRLE